MTLLSATQGPWLAPAAVLQVRKWGGILEHPARSLLWEKMSLPRPEPYRQATIGGPERDAWGGFTVEVDQSAFGHTSHKRTWLYMVGIHPRKIILPPSSATPRMPQDLLDTIARWKPKSEKRPGRKPGARCYTDAISSEARKRTPDAFARWLVDLAKTAKVQPVEKGGMTRRTQHER